MTCDGDQVDYQTRGLVLIPINQNRGTVTLLRVRGFLGSYTEPIGSLAGNELRDHTMHFMLQLVPARPGLVNVPDGIQLLSGNLAPDQESNRILQQWVYPPGGAYGSGGNITEFGASGQAHTTNFKEIDVRVKRRFARAQWALVLSATSSVVAFDTLNRVYCNFRMLFRTEDGI